MLTKEQKDTLKDGDKLICVKEPDGIYISKGDVCTFSNWYNTERGFFQIKEMLNIGLSESNDHIGVFDLFDESIHKEFVMLTEEKLINNRKEFIKKFGN